MPSKKRGVPIKKNRISIILKSRGITVTELAKAIGYNRSALSYALNRGYIEGGALFDICNYLNVSPSFFLENGDPLIRINKTKIDEFEKKYGKADPSGYLVRTIEQEADSKIESFQNAREGVRVTDLVHNMIYRAYVTMGEEGVSNKVLNEHSFFDADFVKLNYGYLVDETYNFMTGQLISVFNEDEKYRDYVISEKMNNESKKNELQEFDSFLEVIPPDQEPDE